MTIRKHPIVFCVKIRRVRKRTSDSRHHLPVYGAGCRDSGIASPAGRDLLELGRAASHPASTWRKGRPHYLAGGQMQEVDGALGIHVLTALGNRHVPYAGRRGRPSRAWKVSRVFS